MSPNRRRLTLVTLFVGALLVVLLGRPSASSDATVETTPVGSSTAGTEPPSTSTPGATSGSSSSSGSSTSSSSSSSSTSTSSSSTSTTEATTTTTTADPAPATTETTVVPDHAPDPVAAPEPAPEAEPDQATGAPSPSSTSSSTTAAPAPTTTTTQPPSGDPAAVIREVFGPHAEGALAIAECESNLDPSAVNPAGYHGLFQIGDGHAAAFERVTGASWESGRYDARANTVYARHLFDRSGWSPWGCSHHG